MDESTEAARRAVFEEKPPAYEPIRDYAVIGDCHGAALVSRSGSVDWCCLERFDADPVLCRLLDAGRGGYLSIRPTRRCRSTRAYVPGTNILRTTFADDAGSTTVTDFMPVGRQPGSGTHNYVRLNAPAWLVRIIECERGTMSLQVRYRPSIDFAQQQVRLRGAAGRMESGAGPCLYHNLARMHITDDVANLVFEAHAGERHVLVLTPRPAAHDPAASVDLLLQSTHAFWAEWSDYCRYHGRYREAVLRSALALKLLTHAPSGAIVAAATTSLPEEIGGVRNWDYRYCWLRDAPFSLYALATLGYGGEARAFSGYLSRMCEATCPDLRVMYGIGGETELAEHTLDHLEGYRDSRPVRTGNGAHRQRQLDVYGELMDWALLYRTLGGRLDAAERSMLAELADFAAEHWHEPDHGLWEIRSEPRHHVHSKMMSWVALDRAIKLLGVRPQWDAQRRRIVEDVHARGIHPSRGHLLQAYDGDGCDAALLLAPVIGFPLDEAVLKATVETVERELRDGDFVYRYKADDGLPGGEGAFLICSFWLVDAMIFAGRQSDARALFERLLECLNDVGLCSEQVDPKSHTFLGNFPQAFTHLALISAAAHLDLYETQGPQAVIGTHADRARRGIGATLGWRALWAAFKATRRVGRILPSRRSVLSL
jgi:alpha,alpha-trehalase